MKNKNMRRTYLGISSAILLLGITSFLNDLSSEIITPILPMFITALGGGGLAVGIIGGLRDSIASIIKIFAGYWSDKTQKRKIFVTTGYATSAIFKLALAFSKVWQQVLLFASIERIGKGIRTAPRDAIIADSMPKERGKGFAVHRAMDTAGAVAGAIMAFILWSIGLSFKNIILIAAATSCLALIPLFFLKKRKKTEKKITLKISVKNISPRLRSFIIISGIFALANFSYMFFILKAQELFTGKSAIGIPLLLYILFNTAYVIFTIPFGKLADRIGKGKVILIGYAMFSITCLGFAFLHTLMAAIILFALYGIVYAIIESNQRAYISDLAVKEGRGTALGAFHTITGIVTLPASLIGGSLWQIDPKTTFIYGAVTSLFAATLLMLHIYRKKSKK